MSKVFQVVVLNMQYDSLWRLASLRSVALTSGGARGALAETVFVKSPVGGDVLISGKASRCRGKVILATGLRRRQSCRSLDQSSSAAIECFSRRILVSGEASHARGESSSAAMGSS